LVAEAALTTITAFDEPMADIIRLWLGLLLPPLAWSVQLGSMYALQPWLCAHGGVHAPNDLISVLAAIIAAVGGVVAWRRRLAVSRLASDPTEQRRSRACFMASLGVALSAIFVLVIFAQWIPNHLLSSCPA
jgi:hypothetical protein